MNDEELDRLVAQSMYSNTDVRALDLRVGEADLMENVMNSATPIVERPQPVRPKPPRRRSKLFTGLVVGAVVAVGGGAAYAVVADRLSPDQAELVDDVGATGEVSCDISSENARLVASTTSDGRTVEYWTVDGTNSHGDFLFEDGAGFGGGGCGPMSRADAYPQLPWANYTLTVDTRDGIAHFTFLGQAPAGTANVDLVTIYGTTNVEVTSPDGYFVAPRRRTSRILANAEFPAGRRTLVRVDAYAADGTLIGTGGLGG